MTISEFYEKLGAIKANTADGEEFAYKVREMVSLLDEGDSEDFYGTEGWKRLIFG